MNFCAAILILKTEENTQHFWHIMLYYFKKGKAQLKHKKDVCSVWRRCCDWLNESEVLCEVCWYCWHFGQMILCCGAVPCIGRCLAAPLASPPEKPIAGDRRHTQNIHNNKVIGENEKYVFYFTEKNVNRPFGQPNINSDRNENDS